MTLRLTIIFLSISIFCKAQNFSGEIQYRLEIIPKSKSLNIDSLISSKKGGLIKYLITSNFYKSTYFDKGEKSYIYTYDNISKRMYDEYPDKPYITYRDSRKANYRYYGSEVFKDSTTNILGKECFMVKYDSDYGKTTIYYSEEVKVDYKTFEGHKIGNWYEKLKEVDGSISLKSITEFEDYYEVREAFKITPISLSENDFEVPSNKMKVASYSALDDGVNLIEPNQTMIQCYQEKVESGTKYKNDKSKVQCFLSILVNKNGEISHIEPYDKTLGKLNDIAIDIIKDCGFKFTSGKIDGRKVSSLAYFPIEF